MISFRSKRKRGHFQQKQAGVVMLILFGIVGSITIGLFLVNYMSKILYDPDPSDVILPTTPIVDHNIDSTITSKQNSLAAIESNTITNNTVNTNITNMGELVNNQNHDQDSSDSDNNNNDRNEENSNLNSNSNSNEIDPYSIAHINNYTVYINETFIDTVRLIMIDLREYRRVMNERKKRDFQEKRKQKRKEKMNRQKQKQEKEAQKKQQESNQQSTFFEKLLGSSNSNQDEQNSDNDNDESENQSQTAGDNENSENVNDERLLSNETIASLYKTIDFRKLESLNGNKYKIWKFDAQMHLFVSIIVIPRLDKRYLNAQNICNVFLKYGVTCELFVGFDAINHTRNEICNEYSHWIDNEYCLYNATTVYKLADIISKVSQFEYMLKHVFKQNDCSIGNTSNTKDDMNNSDCKDYKYYLMLEDDAMVNDNIVFEINKYVNRLIEAKIKEYIIKHAVNYYIKYINPKYASSRFNETILQLTPNFLYSIAMNTSASFYNEYIGNLSQFSVWNDKDSSNFISNTFDIFQLYPNWWCWEREGFHYQEYLYSSHIDEYSNGEFDSDFNSDIFLYHHKPLMFSLTTALMFREYTIEYIFDYLPIFDNSDVFISYLMNYKMTYPRKSIQTYALCPCIVGDIGGNSTLGTGKVKDIHPPGWQYTVQQMIEINKIRKKKRRERAKQRYLKKKQERREKQKQQQLQQQQEQQEQQEPPNQIPVPLVNGIGGPADHISIPRP